jgi:hypothetical protein
MAASTSGRHHTTAAIPRRGATSQPRMATMMTAAAASIKFSKYQGLGNDFILVSRCTAREEPAISR